VNVRPVASGGVEGAQPKKRNRRSRTKKEIELQRRAAAYQTDCEARDTRIDLVLKGVIMFLKENAVLKDQLEKDKNELFSRENAFERYDFDSNMQRVHEQTVNESIRPSVIQPPMITNPRIRLTIPTLADRFSFDDNHEPFFEPEMDSNTTSFPKKIWAIVNSKACKSIWWFDDGRSFLINKRWIKQEGEILDGQNKWMNISDYSSLVRQLNLYGFRKVKRVGDDIQFFKQHVEMLQHPFGLASIPDLDEFRHTFFRFDNGYDKVQFIKRQKPFKPTNSRPHPEMFDPKVQKVSARSHMMRRYTPADSPGRYSDDSSMFECYDDSGDELNPLGTRLMINL
jgi:hypothetical protein